MSGTRWRDKLGIPFAVLAAVGVLTAAAPAPAPGAAQPVGGAAPAAADPAGGPCAPQLRGRALLPATAYQPGPVSGTQLPPTPVNGVTPPFPGQPVPGFSAVIPAVPGDTSGRLLLAMPDNGFGAKTNSADFLLRAYLIEPRYRTGARHGGTGGVQVRGFLRFRDPDRRVPFPIVNGDTPQRLLTGADLDIESLARDARGDLWIGDEFGPYLIRTDRTGKVLQAPIPLPDGTKSPQSPDLRPGERRRCRPAAGSRRWR